MINIEGLSHAAVLAALYNGSRPQGMGFMQYKSEPMTEETAEKLLEKIRYFDYLQGRVMKLELKHNATEFDERLYDRDNGNGAAQRIINTLRDTKNVNNEMIQKQHIHQRNVAAADVMGRLDTPTHMVDNTIHLGLDDVAAPLAQKVINAVSSEFYSPSDNPNSPES